MTLRMILAASAVLAFAAPAIAQDAPPASAPAEAPTPEQVALEAKGTAFKARMDAMAAEMESALTATNGDAAAAGPALDAIVARYQPDADAFATELETFINAEAARTTDEAQKAELTSAATGASAVIRGIPAQARSGLAQAAAASVAAPPVQ